MTANREVPSSWSHRTVLLSMRSTDVSRLTQRYTTNWRHAAWTPLPTLRSRRIGASETDIEVSRLLTEDELIARVVRARDRQLMSPMMVEDLNVDEIPLVPLVDPNKTEW